MKHCILVLIIGFCSQFANSQTNHANDTNYVASLPDTITLKLPMGYFQLLSQILNNQDYSHKAYLEFLNIIQGQVTKQVVYKKKQK